MVQPKPAIPVLNLSDPISTSLLAAHPLVDGIGAVVSDLSGNGYDGAATGGYTWINDPELGVVLELDGTSGHVLLSTAINAIVDVQTGATAAFWLKLRNATPAATAQSGLIVLQDFAGASSATHYPDTDGLGYFGTFRELARVNSVALGAVDRTTWHHLAITAFSAGTYRIYINGVEVGSAANEFGIHATIAAAIGMSSDSGGSYYLDGWLGDFRLWSRQLLAPEVLTIFNDPWAIYVAGGADVAFNSINAIADVRLEQDPSAGTLLVQADLRDHQSESAKALLMQGDLSPVTNNAAQFLGAQVDVTPTAQTSYPPLSDAINPQHKPDTPVKFASQFDTDMVVAIPFAEGTGTAAADFAGSAGGPHGATLIGAATWLAGGFKANDYAQALALDPNASYAEITRHPEHEPATSITLAAWVTPSALQGSRAIIAKLGTSGFSYYLGTDSTTDNWRFQVQDNVDGTATLDSVATFAGGDLVHLVTTYEGTVMRIYVNGVESNFTGNSGTIVYDITKNVRIGQGEGGSSFLGTIDDVRIWDDRVLDAAEILDLYRSQFGIYCNAGVTYSLNAIADVRLEQDPSVGNLLVQADLRGYPSVSTIALLLQADLSTTPSNAATFLGAQIDIRPPISNPAGMSIVSVFPSSGTKDGGTAVTLRGLKFENITDVQFGGVSLTSVVNPDSSTITGITGPHVPGFVDVTVFSATLGNITLLDTYAYVPFFGTGADLLIKGVQLDPSLIRTEYFTGETAPLSSNTTLTLVMADYPVDVSAVELYIRRVGESGGTLQRQGAIYQYTVDLVNRQIVWRDTATFALIATDEIIVRYVAQGAL